MSLLEAINQGVSAYRTATAPTQLDIAKAQARETAKSQEAVASKWTAMIPYAIAGVVVIVVLALVFRRK